MTTHPPSGQSAPGSSADRGGRSWPGPQRTLEAGIDFEHANAARMYDYYLGGGANFDVDRERANAVLAANPHVLAMARANRTYLARVVRWCQEQGIEQFLDLGSGVPTVGNVHEIAHQNNPAARVAYVDFEPVVAAHAQELGTGRGRARPGTADSRRERDDHPRRPTRPGCGAGCTRPVALLAAAVLHFIDTDPAALLKRYREVLVPGSVIAVSHASSDHDDPQVAAHARAAAAAYTSSTTPLTLRDRHQVRALLDGLDLVSPGLVDVRDWPQPRPNALGAGGYGALAHLPQH